MLEKVTVSHRGARYEIGRAEHFYGIWAAGTSQSQPRPLEWWPDTQEGWSGAWRRFAAIEQPGTITPVRQRVALFTSTAASPAIRVAAVALLAAGVLCGVVGLFPGYLGGTSLAHEPENLVPHIIYLAAWCAAAVLIYLGGSRLRVGALLGLGTSLVTFGLYFSDLGSVIAGGAHLLGAGLALALAGWLACAAGCVVAFRFRSPDAPARPASSEMGLMAVVALAALGVAVAFAPSWDSYILRTSTGVSETVTAGNAFANPGPVIAGDIAVMVALVIVAAAAALWRPMRMGAALLAGAVIPMLAQAISAVIQLGQGVSPAQFGISSAQAAQSGLTIDSGFTAVFWIYCAFVVALAAAAGWMFIASRRDSSRPGAILTSGVVVPPQGGAVPSGAAPSGAAPSGAAPSVPNAPGATSA